MTCLHFAVLGHVNKNEYDDKWGEKKNHKRFNKKRRMINGVSRILT